MTKTHIFTMTMVGRALFVSAATITVLALLADGFPHSMMMTKTTMMVAPQFSFSKRTRICHNINVPSSSIIYSRNIHRDQWPSPGLCLYRGRRGNSRDTERFRKTKNPASFLKDYVKQIYDTLYRKSRAIQRIIRTYTERYTIYVLECEDGKYYVGSTSHRKQRFRQHLTKRGGSSWTRQHKPIRVVKEYKRVPELYYLGLEAKVTAECMLEYGINNVRGAMFALTRNYTVTDLGALTGFLGHYNNLNYKELSIYLQRTLPATKFGGGSARRSRRRKSKVRKERIAHSGDLCYNCGERGHWAADCPNQEEGIF
jgi:putative endonuclease